MKTLKTVSLASLAFIAATCWGLSAVQYSKRCTDTPTQTVGSCSGQAPCTGSKVRTEYDGCKDCTPDETACGLLDEVENCKKRTQVTPCVANSTGYCVEGAAQPFSKWNWTAEKYCN